MNPPKKRLALFICLIALIGSVGIAVFAPADFFRSHGQSNKASKVAGPMRIGVAPGESDAKIPPIAVMAQLRSLLKPTGATVRTGSMDVAGDESNKNCGLAPIKFALAGNEQQTITLSSEANDAISRAAKRLLSSGTELERAQALSLQASLAGNSAYDVKPGIRHQCGDNDECSARLNAERLRAITPYVTALSQLAVNTSDPAVYAAAFHQCRSNTVPACTAVSAERWAALDPSNAVPLLMIASAAVARNDLAARDRALLAASTALLYDPRTSSLLHIAQTDTIQTEQPSAAILASVTLFALDSILLAPDYSTILRYCAPPGDVPLGRRDVCSRLAEKMLEQDQLLLGRKVAERLAGYAGWPAERLAAIADENDAMYQIMQTTTFDFDQMASCDGRNRLQTWFSDMSRVGEVAALRQRVATSGKTIAELAEERRAAARKFRKELNEAPDK